jgi:large subunit ribosomal protein L1
MKRQSKRYKQATSGIEAEKSYPLKETISILKKCPQPKFDASVDLHFHLNVDPKQSNQMVRGTVLLPHGTGKKIKIAVFCKGEGQSQAHQAGADYVGANDLIEKVAAGFLDFDCAIATPDIMKDLAKLGKVLGPRGLMPSPKTGTVTNDIKKAIEDLKKGKIEFKIDKQRGIHISIGKISFEEQKLYDNASKAIAAINEARPQATKGKFISSMYISATMNPGISLVF